MCSTKMRTSISDSVKELSKNFMMSKRKSAPIDWNRKRWSRQLMIFLTFIKPEEFSSFDYSIILLWFSLNAETIFCKIIAKNGAPQSLCNAVTKTQFTERS